MELEGKVAIVTGSAQGLGKAIALTLAREGAQVVISDLNLKGAEDVAREIEALGQKGIALEIDVCKKQDVEAMVKKTLSRFGQIDILVNNAGISSSTPIVDIEEQEWDRILSVNLKGTFLCSQSVFKEMIKKRHGKIVNIASAAAKIGGLVVGAHYSASKAGVICFTKSLALQAAPYKINVNAVCPGPQDTGITKSWSEDENIAFKNKIPWKEYGKPQDVAEGVLFLISDRARYITGEILDINGGLIMD